MKKILLTIDYEVYLGSNTGTVRECMIEPTKRLMDILSQNQSKMTVFWDILHFYKLLELENEFSELKEDRIAIQNQIIDLVKQGHDIQLHIHSHWLDSTYEDNNWKFIYDKFKLHTLSNIKDSTDINTILGCVTISKNLIEKIVHQVDSSYKVSSFRAGGYLIQPFEDLKYAFLKNDIFIDSSVCPDMINRNNIFSFNFKNYPKNQIYNFERDLSIIDPKGNFTEIPITTYRIPLLMKIYFTLMKRYKYNNFVVGRKGSGSESSNKENLSFWQKLRSYVVENNFDKLTSEMFCKKISISLQCPFLLTILYLFYSDNQILK